MQKLISKKQRRTQENSDVSVKALYMCDSGLGNLSSFGGNLEIISGDAYLWSVGLDILTDPCD